jgi:hypothetical protein
MQGAAEGWGGTTIDETSTPFKTVPTWRYSTAFSNAPVYKTRRCRDRTSTT